MRLLITGNLGYIGSVLTNRLDKEKFDITGIDTGYYRNCTYSNITSSFNQIYKDIREITKQDIEGYESVIHLASLSNDPLGELNPNLTNEINYVSTMKLANLAKAAGVERFVYASSQSMYGISNIDEELDEDKSEKNPITTYAKTKWNAEVDLKKLSNNNFVVSCFRPSTVFGSSPRLRCDIVFNNLLSSAYTLGKIDILSDGSPWRPVIHINDVCDAFLSGLIAPKEIVEGESFNVGIKNGNFTVLDLAEAAKKLVPGCEIRISKNQNDARTYKVSFDKILTNLKDYFKPKWNLESGGKELIEYFKEIDFNYDMFKDRHFTRLSQLQYLQKKRLLDEELKWI
ncbi:MAG: UDP-glucose 4-epimerase [Alphaproteobacteria bacterium MarineAlpha5_Bin8]|nr:MAG: UDP-glucose 4-epimerase [Alphaproteobacteria bacterium MarineAlpha5_Bin8]PPR53887.1 MAG: UDP-glucose 4-epimerase [Alphaproteobacteria bacterium MarineAlpha5_Bin6]|tara:strand:- start:1208 stop:2236 length:1029 start_codon:yes stop_codon:yes gene_type:complete